MGICQGMRCLWIVDGGIPLGRKISRAPLHSSRKGAPQQRTFTSRGRRYNDCAATENVPLHVNMHIHIVNDFYSNEA